MNHIATTADFALTKKLDDLFHNHRKMLWGVSYRMTGCAVDTYPQTWPQQFIEPFTRKTVHEKETYKTAA